MGATDNSFTHPTSIPGSESRSYGQKHILIVENNKRVSKYVRRIVETHLGARVQFADTGNEAMALLENAAFDVLLTEMMLEGVHGLELVRFARTAFPEMGIILMTEQAMRFPFVEAVRAGATDFIQKPFLPAELDAKMIRIFNEQTLRHERQVEARKYRSLFELSIDGMALLDGSGSVIEDINPAFQELCGEKKSNIIGRPVVSMLDESDRKRFEQWLSLCTLIGRGAIADLKLMHAQGANVFVDVSITVVQGEKKTGVFLAFKDVTERRDVQLRLAEAAQRDALTGLFNRRAFTHHIHGAVRSAHENSLPMTLMIIDLDGFKQCNDEFGHQAGDQVLIETATVISMSTRSAAGDSCFRYGGDEFAVLLAGVDAEEGRVVARRIQAEFAKRETHDVTMSIGLAEYRDEFAVEDLVRAADQAMYEAKESGKNAVCLFRP